MRLAGGWPAPGEWLVTAAICAVYLLAALPVALTAGLLEPRTSLPLPAFAVQALRVLLLPALVEELIFRVLPNPHPSEDADRRAILVAAALSLGAYVLVHPLVGWLSQTANPFTAPAFLLLTFILGVACLLLYRRTGSLWPPLVLHWLVVTGWLALGGRGILPPA